VGVGDSPAPTAMMPSKLAGPRVPVAGLADDAVASARWGIH